MFKDSAIASIEFILTCNTLLPTLGAEAEITLECCKIKSKFNKCCMPQIKEVLLQIIFLEGAPKLNEQRAIFKTLHKFFLCLLLRENINIFIKFLEDFEKFVWSSGRYKSTLI